MRQPWPRLGDSPCRVGQRALVQILALVAALGSGKEAVSGRDPATVDSALKERCYSIGACAPTEEPSGDAVVVCSILERSVRCMAAAADACRLLNFPQQLQEIHDTAVRELTQELGNYCADVMTGTASSLEPWGVTDRADEDPYDDPSEGEGNEGVEITDVDMPEDDVNSGVVSVTSACGLLMLTTLWSAILAAQSYARIL